MNQYQICGCCLFFKRFDSENFGECRRNSPMPLTRHVDEEKWQEGFAVTEWPVTHEDEFCGEFRAFNH
jgi:hypothetical protein